MTNKNARHATTNGMTVTVETFYQQDYSNPMQHEFMFAYRITITNNNPFPVKLLSRHLDIFDSDGSYRVVDGDGVVGMQPVIAASEEYQYVSGCNLHTEIGRMNGEYTMQKASGSKSEKFQVATPVFWMITPFKLN